MVFLKMNGNPALLSRYENRDEEQKTLFTSEYLLYFYAYSAYSTSTPSSARHARTNSVSFIVSAARYSTSSAVAFVAPA